MHMHIPRRKPVDRFFVIKTRGSQPVWIKNQPRRFYVSTPAVVAEVDINTLIEGMGGDQLDELERELHADA